MILGPSIVYLTKEEFDTLDTKVSKNIYLLTDTEEMILQLDNNGIKISDFETVATVSDLPSVGEEAENKFYYVTATNSLYKVVNNEWKMLGGASSGSAELSDTLKTTISLGGIEAETTYAQGTSLEQILRDMLEPTLYPKLVAPSCNLTGTGSKVLETGTTLSVTLTANFSRGSIDPAYGTSGYRSGVATGYKLNNGDVQVGNTWSTTVTSTNRTFTVNVAYEAGEQPKDNEGNDYQSALPAGNVNSNTLTYSFVDAMWANTSDITTVSKLGLVAKTTGSRTLVFPAQTTTNPAIFDVPSTWNVTKIEVLNELSGEYRDCTSEYTQTTTTHEGAVGNVVNYKRYTDNRGYNAGSRTIKVSWN